MSNVDTFSKNWSQRIPALLEKGVPVEDITPIITQDFEQVKRGNQPINDTEGIYQVINRVTGKSLAGTKKRDTGFHGFLGLKGTLGNIIPSAADIFTGIGGLIAHPSRLYNEAKATYNSPFGGPVGAIKTLKSTLGGPEAMRKQAEEWGITRESLLKETPGLANGGIGDVIHAVATTPGTRLLPGAFTLPRLFSGQGRTELQQNPTMAVLDVLPIAGKAGRAASLTGEVGRAVEPALAADIRAGGRAARLAAPKAFEAGSVREALAANRPIKALSRQTGLTSKVLDPLAEHFNISKLDRGLGKAKAVGERGVEEEVRQSAVKHLTAREDLGYTPEQAEALYDRYINRHSSLPPSTQDAAAFQYIDSYLDDLVDNPNTPFFRDHEGEIWSTKDPTGLLVKRIIDSGSKIDDLRPKIEEKLANAAEKVFSVHSGEKAPSAIAQGERGMAYWEGKLAGLDAKEQALQAQYEKVTSKSFRTASGVQANPVPARFVPLVNREILGKLAEAYADDPVVLKDIQSGLVPLTGQLVDEARLPGTVDKRLFNQIRNESIANWRNIRAEGANPGFVPTVTPAKAARLDTGSLLVDRIPTPGIERGRSVLSSQPAIKDPFVALIATDKDYALQAAAQEFETNALRLQGHVLPKQQALEEVRNKVREFQAANPDADAVAFEDSLLKEFKAYDPEKFGIKPATRGAEELIRAPVAKALEQLVYKDPNALLKTLNKAQGVFKTTALLSLTYPTNNLLGNIAMVSAEATPSTLRYVPKAWKAAWDGFRSGHPSTHIPVELPHGRLSNIDMSVDQAYKFNQGSKLGVIWQKLMNNKFLSKWHDLNARMDDFSRNLVYFQDLAENGGDVGQAIKRASEVINDFDELTPIERNVIKQVIPFYTFQRHLFKYAFRYPADHPIRAQIVQSVIRQNLEEGGLPERFKSMFWLGKPDAKGEQWRVDARALNPFNDFADNFTLGGFLANSSPLISGPIKALGISDLSGAPIYTRRTYNPKTGRFETVRDSNNYVNLLTEFVPQFSKFQSLVDPGSRYPAPSRQGGQWSPFSLAQRFVGIPGNVGVTNTDRERFLTEQARIRFGNEAVQSATSGRGTDDLNRINGLVSVNLGGSKYVLPAGTAAKVIKNINKLIKEGGWEGSPSSVLPR